MDLQVLRMNLANWLEKMSAGLELGRFKFCEKGSHVPTAGARGLFTTCFAVKAAWQSGIWEDWPIERQKACIQFINCFQNQTGYFYDPWLINNFGIYLKSLKLLLFKKISSKFFMNVNYYRLQAETRQAASTLIMVNTEPMYPLPTRISNPIKIYKYLKSLDWTKPWAAASYLSHIVFMITINNRLFGLFTNYDELIDSVFLLLNNLRDYKTGAWFRGNPTDYMKVNGAMKVLSALQWIEREYPHSERLIDLALKQEFQNEGCGFLNRLFVIQQTRKSLSNQYKDDEIKCLAHKSLLMINKFQRNDGGFSFHIDRSQQKYNLLKVSEGLPVGDMHGAVMITWAIAVALDLLGNEKPLGGNNWKCQKP